MRVAKRWMPVCVVLVLGLAGCSSMTVSIDTDPSEDFSGFRTFDWLPGAKASIDDPRVNRDQLDKRIRHAVESRLTAKGYIRQSGATPDFWVAYHANLKDRVQVSQLNANYGYGSGWGWRYGNRYRPPRLGRNARYLCLRL